MFHPSFTRITLGAPDPRLTLFRERAAREKAAAAASAEASAPAPVVLDEVLTPHHGYCPMERHEWARLTQGIAPEFCGHLCGATSQLHGDLIRSRLLEKQPGLAKVDTAGDRAALMVTLMSMDSERDSEADTLDTDSITTTATTNSPSKDA